jgi:ABC-2 type transport system permease protein
VPTIAAISVLGTCYSWKNLGVLLAWGAAGTLIAVRRFRWDPRPE